MIRTLNFFCIAITGLVCLGLYRLAEEARVASADLRSTQAAIENEHNALTVLGAEWARVTRPARIQALAARHLDLVDKPVLQLSSLTQLPLKDAPKVMDIREAKVVAPSAAARARTVLLARANSGN
jgi:hypothetical protein